MKGNSSCVMPMWQHAAKRPCCGVKHGNWKDLWSSSIGVVGKFSKIIIITHNLHQCFCITHLLCPCCQYPTHATLLWVLWVICYVSILECIVVVMLAIFIPHAFFKYLLLAFTCHKQQFDFLLFALLLCFFWFRFDFVIRQIKYVIHYLGYIACWYTSLLWLEQWFDSMFHQMSYHLVLVDDVSLPPKTLLSLLIVFLPAHPKELDPWNWNSLQNDIIMLENIMVISPVQFR